MDNLHFAILMVMIASVGIVLLVEINILHHNNHISDLEFAEEAMTRFAENHNYTEDYNCVNYSEDFEETMENLGIKTEISGGIKPNKTSGHLWNKISFHLEPQTGELKLFKGYKEYNGAYLGGMNE